MKKITIAIDGHSSCGKSTMAKDLAREIGYIYIDSGAMYRAVTYYCLQHDLFTEDNVKLDALQAAMPNIHISFKLNDPLNPVALEAEEGFINVINGNISNGNSLIVIPFFCFCKFCDIA